MEEIFIKEEPLFFSDDPALSEKSGDGEKGGDSSPPVGADLIKKEEPQESCVGEWVPIPSSLPTHDEKFSIKEEPEIKDDELDLHSEPLTPESSSFKADQVEDVSSTEKSSGKESEATYFGSSYLTCPTSQSKSLSNVGSPKADGKCSSRMDDLKLIELVRAHKCLYDAKNKHYKDAQVRDNVWKEISDEMKQPRAVCKDTWTKLRNAYTNARKRRKTRSGQAANTVLKWKYEDQMSFLIPTLEPRSTQGNVKTLSPGDVDVSIPVSNENTEDLNQSQVDKNPASEKGAAKHGNQETAITDRTDNNGDQHAAESTSTPKQPKCRKRQILDSSMTEIVQIMKDNSRMQAQSLQLSEGDQTHRDETEMFFLSIASSVKSLSAIEQARVKMEISNMVFEAQIREMEQQNLYQNTASGPFHPPVIQIPSPSPTSSVISLSVSNPNCSSTSTTASPTPLPATEDSTAHTGMDALYVQL